MSAVTELAAAIASTLTVPFPADLGDSAGYEKRIEILRERAGRLVVRMEQLAAVGDDPLMLGRTLAAVAAIEADTPVTYRTCDEQAGGSL